jgi:uncharacterized membrane protein
MVRRGRKEFLRQGWAILRLGAIGYAFYAFSRSTVGRVLYGTTSLILILSIFSPTASAFLSNNSWAVLGTIYGITVSIGMFSWHQPSSSIGWFGKLFGGSIILVIAFGWVQAARSDSQIATALFGPPLRVQNACEHRITFMTAFKDWSGRWIADGWWDIEPEQRSLLDRGMMLVRSQYGSFYYYAENKDVGKVWSGDAVIVLNGRDVMARSAPLSVKDGLYDLVLSCN